MGTNRADFFSADAGVTSALNFMGEVIRHADLPKDLRPDAEKLFRSIRALARDMKIQGDFLRTRVSGDSDIFRSMRWVKLGLENVVRFLNEAAKDPSSTRSDVTHYKRMSDEASELLARSVQFEKDLEEQSTLWYQIKSKGRDFLNLLDQETEPTFGGQMARVASLDGKHTLPELPYAYDALEPHISEETLKLHHDKHHKAYVDGLNEAEKKISKARAAGKFDSIPALNAALEFNAGGDFLHTLYWKSLVPTKEYKAPSKSLKKLIEEDFGSWEAFRAQLKESTVKVRGSGWGVLVYTPSGLRVLTVMNHENGPLWDGIVLLPVDAWEHAYYMDYQNDRAAHFDALFDNLVNWAEVENRLKAAKKSPRKASPSRVASRHLEAGVSDWVAWIIQPWSVLVRRSGEFISGPVDDAMDNVFRDLAPEIVVALGEQEVDADVDEFLQGAVQGRWDSNRGLFKDEDPSKSEDYSKGYVWGYENAAIWKGNQLPDKVRTKVIRENVAEFRGEVTERVVELALRKAWHALNPIETVQTMISAVKKHGWKVGLGLALFEVLEHTVLPTALIAITGRPEMAVTGTLPIGEILIPIILRAVGNVPKEIDAPSPDGHMDWYLENYGSVRLAARYSLRVKSRKDL